MVDVYSPNVRSRVMAAVRSKNTKPEMIVRRTVFGMGYRYRLHVKSIPGSPDLVFPGRRRVIFVHGCFWHRHSCGKGRAAPQTNVSFWSEKFRRNKERDRKIQQSLRTRGWRYLVIWECQTRDVNGLKRRIERFLNA